MRFLRALYVRWLTRPAERWFDGQRLRRHVFGPAERVHLGLDVELMDAVLNTVSGHITIGDYSFCGHRVSLITGTHDVNRLRKERADYWPVEGRDIVIGSGVWLGTGAIVLGPCSIGDDAVVAAGALVRGDVAAGAIVAGVPAREIGKVDTSQTGRSDSVASSPAR